MMKEKIIEHSIHKLFLRHGRPILNSQTEILKRIEADLGYLQQITSGDKRAWYRQPPIPQHLISQHEANVKFVEAE